MLGKIVTFLSGILLFLAIVIVILSGPATGYEVSIYEAYPLHFWALLMLSSALGTSLLVYSAFNPSSSDNFQCTIAGLITIMLSNSILLLLPFFRNYPYIGWADTPAQIGHIRDIQLTGCIGTPFSHWENPYPALHILVLTSSSVLGLSIEDIVKIFPAFFFAFFTISLYLLSKMLSPSKSLTSLIVTFGALPVYTPILGERITHLIPRIATFLLSPFLLYLYFSTKRSPPNKLQIPLLLWLLILPTWHPGDAFIFILTFLCIYFNEKLFEKHATPKSFTQSSGKNKHHLLVYCLILTFSWVLWFTNLNWFNLTVKNLILFFGYAEIENTFRVLERAEMSFFDTIILFIKMTVHLWIYFLVGIISSICLLWRLITHRKVNKDMLSFALLFLFYLTVTSTSYLLIPIGSVRAFPYIILSSSILTGFTISQSLVKKVEVDKKKTLKNMLLVLLLLLPSIIFSQLNAYSSPFIRSVNDQVSLTVVSGFKLFLTNQFEQFLIEDAGLNQKTKVLEITGYKNAPRNLRDWELVKKSLPDHFGYDKHSNLGMWYEKDRYLIIDQMSKIHYEKVIPEYREAWRWSSEDFNKLDDDYSVLRIYDNGGFWIFYIRGMTGPSKG